MTNKSEYLNAFYTPIIANRIILKQSEYDAINKIILKLEQENWINQQPSQVIEEGVYESPHSFFQREEPEINNIARQITSKVIDVVCKLNNYTNLQKSKLLTYVASWFHVTRKNGFVQPHNHPNASWSAVCCTDEGIVDINQTKTSLVLMNPNPIPMYMDAGNANINLPLASDTIRFHLKVGDLIIFPSNIMHFVTPHLSSNERITIAANFWFNIK